MEFNLLSIPHVALELFDIYFGQRLTICLRTTNKKASPIVIVTGERRGNLYYLHAKGLRPDA